MPERDWFATIIERFGELTSREQVTVRDRNQYVGRVPNALIQFWAEHGRGNIGRTEQWICDPAPFAPLIEYLFQDDPDFKPADMTVFAYTAFGFLSVWHQQKRFLTIDLNWSMVLWVGGHLDEITKTYFPPDYKDPQTGLLMSPDFQIGRALYPLTPPLERDTDGEDLFPKAVTKLGPLKAGEIFGFFPAPQLGGEWRLENLQKADIVVYGLIAAQAKPFELHALTPPEPPQFPFGRMAFVRSIGKP